MNRYLTTDGIIGTFDSIAEYDRRWTGSRVIATEVSVEPTGEWRLDATGNLRRRDAMRTWRRLDGSEFTEQISGYYTLPTKESDICLHCGYDNGPHGESRVGFGCGYCSSN